MSIARLPLLSILLVLPAFPQTAAVAPGPFAPPVAAAAPIASSTILLQRAIYLEETAGDVESAIQIYRQILSAGGDARTYEAEAQYHLGTCFLRKGNRAQAARSFQDLMRKHPEETGLISRATVHYVDPMVGYSLTVPGGWTLRTRRPYNGGPGTCTELGDPETKAKITICAKGDRTPAGAIDQRLSTGELAIVQERGTRIGYTLRPGSPTPGIIGGQRSLTVLADYSNSLQVEWITWVQSENTRASVVVDLLTSDYEGFQARFTPILNSFRIP